MPYQVVGGLAARSYGATRPLNDIDLYVPDGDLARVATLADPFVTRKPCHHRDGHWDLTFMKLAKGLWEIELGGADTARYFDGRRGEWIEAEIDFSDFQLRLAEGVEIRVIPFRRLVRYKRALGRPVDLQDLRELRAADP